MDNKLAERQEIDFLKCELMLPEQEPIVLTVGEIKMPKESENFCLSCGDRIPIIKSFCSEGCENNFYDETDFERAEKEEDEELYREEMKMKAGVS